MKLKLRVGDFRVRELLAEDVVGERGGHRVYRVTKRKLTSPEAAEVLAKEAGVEIGDVSMAGLKDRQGITIQHMSVPQGRDVLVEHEGLKIEPIGFSEEALTSAVSLGNAFEITVRALGPGELERLRQNIAGVRSVGLPNYFDDQRFGNLRHGQGWIAIDLMRGEIERALRTLLCHHSESDPDHLARFKQRLDEHWGDFLKAAEDARRYGRHRSVFEHLVDNPGDFAGAFRFVSSRERLIHLYAFQSHLWNRAVSDLFREDLPEPDQALIECSEGRLMCPAERLPAGLDPASTFMLPGETLADVSVPRQRLLLADGLARHGLVPSQYAIHGVEGFQIKGEPRALLVIPRHLRVRPAEVDPEHPGLRMVKMRFELPRGAYATLVVKRLFAPVGAAAAAAYAAKERSERGAYRGARPAGLSADGQRADQGRGPRSGSRPDQGRGQGRSYGRNYNQASSGQRDGSPQRSEDGQGPRRPYGRPYGAPRPGQYQEGAAFARPRPRPGEGSGGYRGPQGHSSDRGQPDSGERRGPDGRGGREGGDGHRPGGNPRPYGNQQGRGDGPRYQGPRDNFQTGERSGQSQRFERPPYGQSRGYQGRPGGSGDSGPREQRPYGGGGRPPRPYPGPRGQEGYSGPTGGGRGPYQPNQRGPQSGGGRPQGGYRSQGFDGPRFDRPHFDGPGGGTGPRGRGPEGQGQGGAGDARQNDRGYQNRGGNGRPPYRPARGYGSDQHPGARPHQGGRGGFRPGGPRPYGRGPGGQGPGGGDRPARGPRPERDSSRERGPDAGPE